MSEPRTPRTEAGRRLMAKPHGPFTLDAILAIEDEAAAAPPIDVERLADALHAMGDACGPFTDDHPVAMHNSQAAAILARLSGPPSGGTDE